MIRSMTGYGEASLHEGGVHYFLEVRSLNSKYFKAGMRLPDDLQGLEAELESELRRRIHRGGVTLTVRCSDSSSAAAYTINQDALSRYLEQIKSAPTPKGLQVVVDAGALLGLPGVLQSPADEEERVHRARAILLKLVDKACAQLTAMRTREGQALVADLRENRNVIASRLERVAARAPLVVEGYEKRLRQRIDAMLKDAGLKIEPADLIREIAVYADRTDIGEELARLRGHVAQFDELISEGEARPIGRTLDFLAQEMLREANTIASKSSDVEISRRVVEVKTAIDRIKEQAQNAE